MGSFKISGRVHLLYSMGHRCLFRKIPFFEIGFILFRMFF